MANRLMGKYIRFLAGSKMAIKGIKQAVMGEISEHHLNGGSHG